MSAEEGQKVQRSANDPRRDNMILSYDKESINKITGDPNAGTAEFYQLISMFVGIYAFMGKVRNHTFLDISFIGKMGSVGSSLLFLHIHS